MARIALLDPAPPTMKNSLRPACWIAASTPMPWSSSWFHSASSRGAACSRFAATRCPPAAVKSAACRGPTLKPKLASASLKPLLRAWVSGRLSMPASSPITGLATPADPGPVGQRRVEDPVQVDHRDAGCHRPAAQCGELAAVVGQDHQRVDLL